MKVATKGGLHDKLDYSVVIPVFNEAENLAELDKEIKATLSKLSPNYEIIYVNDGSSDNSLEVLKKLKGSRIINLNRNYGQATALNAGFRLSAGNIVISLDSDMQNDPADIPKLIRKLKAENLDVVAGWRKKRKDDLGIRTLTKIGRYMRKYVINDNIHDAGCTLRVYKKEAVKSLDLQGEMHRYIIALLRWKGFKIGEEVVNHRPRIHGKTKYSYGKAPRGLIDLFYVWFMNKYSQRPLHIFGYASFASFVVSFIALLLAAIDKIFFSLSLNRNGWFFLGLFFLVISSVFFSFGIVMDMIIRIYLNTSPAEKQYYVRDIINT